MNLLCRLFGHVFTRRQYRPLSSKEVNGVRQIIWSGFDDVERQYCARCGMKNPEYEVNK